MSTQGEPTSDAPRVIGAEEIRIEGSRSLRFEGREHCSQSSYFVVDNDPGQGPGLHRHPYTETWTVLAGEATIVMGEHQVVAHAGDTAVVQPGVWHRFTNTGHGRLQILCVHASAMMQQEWRQD